MICQQNDLFIIYYSPLLFRFSVSNDLKYDAERDLKDIGAKNISVHSLNKVRSFYDTYMKMVLNNVRKSVSMTYNDEV